jgi:hypothetical protein
MPASPRSAASASTTAPAPAPFQRRSFAGTLSPSWTAVAPGDGIKVSGEIACDRTTPNAAPGGDGLAYSGRLRIPRAKSRGLIVGYDYRLNVPGDDVTAPLEVVVKFVGTPDATEEVVSVDFVGREAPAS